MKKILLTTVLIVGAVCILLITNFTNYYSLEARVVEKNNSITIFEDTTGNLWEFKDIKNSYNKKDIVKITWNDKGTDFKEDDEIVKIEIK